MAPRITTSEPAYRAPMNQWQRDRAAGPILPMVDSQGRDMSRLRWCAEFACLAALFAVALGVLWL